MLRNKKLQLTDLSLSGNIFEKALSKVLVNVLKTEEGRMFLESMLRPVNKSAPGSKVGFKINNDSFINSIFQITTFDEGQGNPVACGHIVTAHYKILNSK